MSKRTGHNRYLAAVRRFDARYIRRLLEATGCNISRAAAIARLHRWQVYELMQKAGITRSCIEPGSRDSIESHVTAVYRFRRKFLRRLYRLAGGSVTVAAAIAGMHRTNLTLVLTRYRVREKRKYGSDAWRALDDGPQPSVLGALL